VRRRVVSGPEAWAGLSRPFRVRKAAALSVGSPAHDDSY
jgi:hypothetical protein